MKKSEFIDSVRQIEIDLFSRNCNKWVKKQNDKDKEQFRSLRIQISTYRSQLETNRLRVLADKLDELTPSLIDGIEQLQTEIDMMKDFVKTYYGKTASTEDFKGIVDKHFVEDMSWFFEQWVYGTDIPKYIHSYSVDKVDNTYQVIMKVKQKNVSPDFKMTVPVVVVFVDDSYSVFRIMVDKPNNEIKLPLVGKEVKEVVFNPFRSVLCEVEEE